MIMHDDDGCDIHDDDRDNCYNVMVIFLNDRWERDVAQR